MFEPIRGDSPRVWRRRSSSYGRVSGGSHPPSTQMERSFMKLLYFSKFSSSSGENNGGMRWCDAGVGDGRSWLSLVVW